MDDALNSALDHLRRFRATFNAGDSVDEESGLTADDLDALLNAVPTPSDLEPGGTLTIDDSGKHGMIDSPSDHDATHAPTIGSRSLDVSRPLRAEPGHLR